MLKSVKQSVFYLLRFQVVASSSNVPTKKNAQDICNTPKIYFLKYALFSYVPIHFYKIYAFLLY